MRTLRTEFSQVLMALTVAACLPALARAEERESHLRQRVLILNEVTGEDPIHAVVASLLDDRRGAKKLVSEAARMAGESPQPFTYNATLMLGSLALKVKNYRAAEAFYQLHLEQANQLRSTQGVLASYGGLIASVYANKKYSEAEKLCAELRNNDLLVDTLRNLEFEKDKEAETERKAINRFLVNVIEEEIQAIAQQGDASRAIDTIDRVFKKQANSWPGLDLKGRVYRLSGKNEDALKTYEAERQLIKDEAALDKKDKEKLLDDVAYSLSGVYVELGQIDKAAEQLKALLAKDPDNPTYNNDLGFIWADHDMNLAESEKLIRKALDNDRKQRQKNNPTQKPVEIKDPSKKSEIKDRAGYLDSLAWVLFKQKKYAEAKKYLQQAVQNAEDEDEDGSLEILDHYGDVLLALGDKTEAVSAWKKGVAAAGDSKRDLKRKEEVQQKIKANE